MKPEQVLQIIECIVVVYCGLKIAVGPNPMRWRNRWLKVLFWLLVLLDLITQIVNTSLFKFSRAAVSLHSIFIFVLIYIFFYINIWELFVHNFLFWFTFVTMRLLILVISCHYYRIPLYMYIDNEYHVPWHIPHVASMLMTILIVLWLLRVKYRKKDRPFISCTNISDYKLISVFIIAEGIINQIVFNPDVAYLNVSRDMLILIIVILWSFFVISFIAVLLKIFHEEKNRKLAIELNYAMLKKQYGQLQDDYNEKRRELHNQAHFLYLLKNLLLEGNIEQAIRHLTEKEVETTLEQKGTYTGISTIDFMLNYKIKEAAKYGIAIETNLDIYFCPLEVTDMCILLGNLLDNAIEAVRYLSEDRRIITIKMKNPNNFFLMEISNPYEGERKKKNGRYVTTKENKDIHGLGLVSVEKIVEKLEGLIEIKDTDHMFTVFISLFPKQGQ